MSQFPNDSERLASINAIIQGDMRQLRPWLDQISDIDGRVAKVEEGSGGPTPKVSFDDINPVSLPVPEARASEVRDATIEIATALNALIAKLKRS